MPITDGDGHRRLHASRTQSKARAGRHGTSQMAARGLSNHAEGTLVDAAGSKHDTDVVGSRLGHSVHHA
eukprot:426548-Rhodomonas_salina.1